jgi:hypothetical protein
VGNYSDKARQTAAAPSPRKTVVLLVQFQSYRIGNLKRLMSAKIGSVLFAYFCEN